MKKVTKFFMAALLAGMCSFGYGQDYLNPPKVNEKVLGTVSRADPLYGNDGKRLQNCTGCYVSKESWYKTLLEIAMQQYPERPVDIRGMEVGKFWGDGREIYCGPATGKVVDLLEAGLSQALNKALRNVREGSRIAIDQVTVTSSMDRGEFKDQLIDVLLDKGYKVVAKDYLEKLYDEIKDWESGIYNENTTGKENNFSAVGYYINVKVTETSLRVQVVNVSTGEYEGNATVNF